MAFLKGIQMSFINRIFNFKKNEHYTTALIVAAGMGTRMNSCHNKQVLELNGHPLIAYTINAFQNSETVDEIILVVSEEIMQFTADLCDNYNFDKVSKIVLGGLSRQQSVSNGIKEINSNTKFVAIHDGARPFVSPALIDRTNRCAYEHKAAAPGLKVVNTVKMVDKNSFVKKTIDRDNLRLIQTPQTFELKKYRAYLQYANENGKEFTDDCQLFELKKQKVALIDGEQTNIKITYDDDLPYAQMLAESINLRKETVQ